MLEQFWNFIMENIGKIASAIGGSGILGFLFKDKGLEILARGKARFFYKPAPGTHFTIMVCRLDGDDKGLQTQHVIDAFRGVDGLDVLTDPRKLSIDEKASQREAGVKAEKTARQWLKARKADLLIFGRVGKADASLSLWFVPAHGASRIDNSSYSLTNCRPSKEFEEAFALQLVAMAMANLAIIDEKQGHYLVDILTPIAEKLFNLLKNPPPSLNAEQIGDLNFVLGGVEVSLGEQTG
jgi:hypothetical protein